MGMVSIYKNKNRYILKVFGLSIYDKQYSNNNQLLRVKCFYGLFYYKQNLLELISWFHILGVLVFRVKKISIKYRVVLLFFIPVWIKRVDIKYYRNFINSVVKQNEYDDYYIFLSRSGEFFLSMHHLKAWVAANESKKSVLILTSGYHKNILNMFYNDMPYIYMKNINVQLLSCAISSPYETYCKRNIYIPCYYNYFKMVENDIVLHGTHYYDMLKKQFCMLDKADDIVSYSISKKAHSLAFNIAQYVLDNNFIIISPESLSNEDIDKSFWENVVDCFQKLGYAVFCNAINFTNIVKDTTCIYLTYEEMIALAGHAKAIIGVRSGFLECLAQTHTPLFVLYTDFPRRDGFKRLESRFVLEGFSIKKLPNVDVDNIFEYNVNEYGLKSELINIIIDEFLSKEKQNGYSR